MEINYKDSLLIVRNALTKDQCSSLISEYEKEKDKFEYENCTHAITGNPTQSTFKRICLNPRTKNFDIIHSATKNLIQQWLEYLESKKMFIHIFNEKEVQVLWQTGKYFYPQAMELNSKNIKVTEFIKRMDLAYACSDLIVSRAGATSISELTLVGKPVILVPSPNVSEDHQTKNARALSDVGAAILLPDNEVIQNLWTQIEGVLRDEKKQAVLVDSIRNLALPNSTSDIVNICLKVMNDASK